MHNYMKDKGVRVEDKDDEGYMRIEDIGIQRISPRSVGKYPQDKDISEILSPRIGISTLNRFNLSCIPIPLSQESLCQCCHSAAV